MKLRCNADCNNFWELSDVVITVEYRHTKSGDILFRITQRLSLAIFVGSNKECHLHLQELKWGRLSLKWPMLLSHRRSQARHTAGQVKYWSGNSGPRMSSSRPLNLSFSACNNLTKSYNTPLALLITSQIPRVSFLGL